MRHYLLSIRQPDGAPPPPEVLEPIMHRLAAVNREMQAAGAWVFAGGLAPPGAAVVVRARGRGVVMTDGPYAESKEHIGGITIIRAPDREAALEWGRRLALAIGLLPIEVRPIADDPG